MKYLLRVLFLEYRAIFTNHGVMLIFIGGFLIYPLFYPYPYSKEVLKDIPVVPIDQDHSALSRKLLRWADATEEVRLLPQADDLPEAQAAVLEGKAQGIFLIPKGFEDKVLRGEQAFVSSYGNGCYFLIYRQLFSGLYRATATLSAGVEIRRMTAAGFGEMHARAARDPIPVVTRALFNPVGGYATYVVPAVLILVMQQTLLIGIGTLGGQRNEEFVSAPPLPPGQHESALALLVARTTAYFSIYMLYPVFYLAGTFRLYSLPYSTNLFPILLFLTPFMLAVTLFGMAFNMLFHARETSIPVLLFTSLLAVFLMGFAWPHEAIPSWLRAVSMLIPCTPGALGFIRMNQMGASLYEVQREWFILWGLCGFYGVLAWLGTMYRPERETRGPSRKPATDQETAADAAVVSAPETP